MKRFLLPVLILMLALLLPACGSNKSQVQVGHLQVAVENIVQSENQWSANLVVKNTTKQMQILQYRGEAKYTLVISKGGTEVLRRDFEAMDPEKPEILNLSGEVTRNHIVAWTFKDAEGNKVEPGTYQATLKLNAIIPTGKTVIDPQTGARVPEAAFPPAIGPIQIVVK